MPFYNTVRLPIKVTRPQFSETREVYVKADGSSKVTSLQIRKRYDGETDSFDEIIHGKIAIALGHDNVIIESEKYFGQIVKDGDYAIDWQDFLDYPLAKAKFGAFVTPFDATNSNCISCDDAAELSVVDDVFPSPLNQSTSYTLNVLANDNACCYPATFSIVSFDTDFLTAATIDTAGILHVTTKSLFSIVNHQKLVTYRVTCDQSGNYDDADVYADMNGTAPPVCLAPAESIAGIDTDSAIVFITPPSTAPDHYYYELRDHVTHALIQSGTPTIISGSFTLMGLIANTIYDFQIRSQCSGPSSNNTSTNASNFVGETFTTSPAASSNCGLYRIFATGPRGSSRVSYLDCSGVYRSITIPNFGVATVCALQTGPGLYVDISKEDITDSITITYVSLCH